MVRPLLMLTRSAGSRDRQAAYEPRRFLRPSVIFAIGCIVNGIVTTQTGAPPRTPARSLAAVLVAVFVAGIAASAVAAVTPRDEARKQVEFGIDVAQKGLWKEAIYRWEKAVEVDPTYPAAYNNLAIGYEHEGLFEKARAAYEKALELDPRNSYIRQNYELFKEINDRANRQSPK